jgi:ribosomal protein L10
MDRMVLLHYTGIRAAKLKHLRIAEKGKAVSMNKNNSGLNKLKPVSSESFVFLFAV